MGRWENRFGGRKGEIKIHPLSERDGSWRLEPGVLNRQIIKKHFDPDPYRNQTTPYRRDLLIKAYGCNPGMSVELLTNVISCSGSTNTPSAWISFSVTTCLAT